MNTSTARQNPDTPPATTLLVRPETADLKARRAERDRNRKRAVRAQSPGAERREAYLELAVQLETLALNSPDDTTRAELNRAVYRIRLRGAKTPEACREAVFTRICKSLVELSCREIADDLGLPREDVQAALDYLTGARVDLVEIHTRGGKENCGRKGTVLYYRQWGAIS
jgi:hypothetical protein